MTNSIILILLIIILAPVILVAGFIALAVALTIALIIFWGIANMIVIIIDKMEKIHKKEKSR